MLSLFLSLSKGGASAFLDFDDDVSAFPFFRGMPREAKEERYIFFMPKAILFVCILKNLK